MSALDYASLITWVWKKLESYIEGKKAGKEELKELQEKLQEAIKTAHDSAINSLLYLPPLIMTIKANTCAVELKTTLSHPVRITGNPHMMERHYYSGVRMSMNSLRRRLFHVKREMEKIYEPRGEYEKASYHLDKAFKHHERAKSYFEDGNIKSSLEELELMENETEELGNFLERKLRERMKPLIDTYKLLLK